MYSIIYFMLPFCTVSYAYILPFWLSVSLPANVSSRVWLFIVRLLVISVGLARIPTSLVSPRFHKCFLRFKSLIIYSASAAPSAFFRLIREQYSNKL